MKISVIGLGYIGLPTAALIASKSIKVIGVDKNRDIVNTINQGKIHIFEPELEQLIENVLKNGLLKAKLEPECSDVFIIAVPTPMNENNDPDLSFIKAAVEQISPLLKINNVLIVESTTPVGTTEKTLEWIKKIRPDLKLPIFGKRNYNSDIYVAYCPERVLPGQVVKELVTNDRIIGGLTNNCAKKAQAIYKLFTNGNCYLTDCRTAEMCKLIENSYRDVNIAFANELSLICNKLDINVWELIDLANCHPRVNILKPGPGVGGHCIAVDPWFIVSSSPDEAKLIHKARMVNNGMPKFVIEKINKAVNKLNKHKSTLTIASLGLTFKADVNDLRESPALEIAKCIESMGFAHQLIVEPYINAIPEDFDHYMSKLVDLESALAMADIIVLLVDHKQFLNIDVLSVPNKLFIDTRGILNKRKWLQK